MSKRVQKRSARLNKICCFEIPGEFPKTYLKKENFRHKDLAELSSEKNLSDGFPLNLYGFEQLLEYIS